MYRMKTKLGQNVAKMWEVGLWGSKNVGSGTIGV